MNMPPGIRLSAGLGLASERTGQAGPVAVTARAAGMAAADAAGAWTAGTETTGAAAEEAAAEDCAGHCDVTFSSNGIGVGVAAGFFAGCTPTRTGNVTVVCRPLLAENA